ncbi:hypothetical protein [Buttiauxella gaviniae]|uniref:hypothetical protein n=1 Tax=Buttiauxella gaviniae TaxID=82990 RepID=UPI003974887B
MLDLTALDLWLRVDTWDTHHPSDQERFYKAVYKVILANFKLVEPLHIENYILNYFSEKVNQEHIEEIAEIYTEKYNVIYSFLIENKIKL